MVQSPQVSELLLEPLSRPLGREGQQRLHGQVVGADVVEGEVDGVALGLHRGDQILNLREKDREMFNVLCLKNVFEFQDLIKTQLAVPA